MESQRVAWAAGVSWNSGGFIPNRFNPVDHQWNFSPRPGAGQTIEVRVTGYAVYTRYPAFQQMVKDIDSGCPDTDNPVFRKGIALIG